MGFPIITRLIQMQFEREERGKVDRTPMICGTYGRACQQMDKREGANRANCMYCPLAAFAQKKI